MQRVSPSLPNNPNKSDDTIMFTALLSIGVIVLLVASVCILVYCLKQKRRQKLEQLFPGQPFLVNLLEALQIEFSELNVTQVRDFFQPLMNIVAKKNINIIDGNLGLAKSLAMRMHMQPEQYGLIKHCHSYSLGDVPGKILSKVDIDIIADFNDTKNDKEHDASKNPWRLKLTWLVSFWRFDTANKPPNKRAGVTAKVSPEISIVVPSDVKSPVSVRKRSPEQSAQMSPEDKMTPVTLTAQRSSSLSGNNSRLTACAVVGDLGAKDCRAPDTTKALNTYSSDGSDGLPRHGPVSGPDLV